jgi:hypothetical protein
MYGKRQGQLKRVFALKRLPGGPFLMETTIVSEHNLNRGMLEALNTMNRGNSTL